MDGNGRWATRRGLARFEGHRRGKDSVRAVVDAARELGIPYLTLFAFSSENWQRPGAEVRFLMQLLHRYLITETKRMMKRDIRLIALGDCTRLPLQVQKALKETVECTAGNRAMTVALAVSYSGRQEIVRATRRIAEEVAAGTLRSEDIDECTVASRLDTAGLPDPDLRASYGCRTFSSSSSLTPSSISPTPCGPIFVSTNFLPRCTLINGGNAASAP
jgi:undecaprenyl diphosphate synthase